MHVMGYRVETSVLVVAAVAAVLALAGVVWALRQPSDRARRLSGVLVAAIAVVIAAVSLTPDRGRDGSGSCSWEVTRYLAPWYGNQALLNVLMYVPLGFFAVLRLRGRRAVAGAVVAMVLAPLVIEQLQRTSLVGRSCDVEDMIANVAGGMIGVAAGLGWRAVARRVARSPRVGARPPSAT